MTLFRELPEPNRDKFVEISLKQQEAVRGTFLDAGNRAQTFLSVILLLGVVLGSLMIHEQSKPQRSSVIALASFLVGLICVGFLHATSFETTRVVLLRATKRLRRIFRSEIPVEAADTPPISLRWMYATSTLAYLAFLLWIVGAAAAFASFTSKEAIVAETPVVSPLHAPASSLEKEQAPMQQAPTPPSFREPDHSKWTVSDTVASIGGLVAFLQFIALIATYWVMRNTGRQQLRAYALANSFALFEGLTMTPPNLSRQNEPGVIIEMKNFGQTPAYRFVSWAMIQVIEPINEDKLFVPELADISSQTLPTNGVTTKALWFGRPLTPNEIADIQQGIRMIYVHGRVEYRDVFKRQRHSNFRVAYRGTFPPVGTPVMTFRDKGNESV